MDEQPNYLRRVKNSKYKTYGIGLVVILAVVALLVVLNPFSSKSSQAAFTADKNAVRDALAVQDLNKEFKFPLKDDKGETVGEIKYIVENVELRDEIVVKGRKASAVSGRAFVVFNLKIVNDSNKNISMNTKDYVRLFVNNNDNEPLSPSIHNDPVVVDAISVKPTRVGFAINKSDKDLKIKVGEIKGDKETIELTINK